MRTSGRADAGQKYALTVNCTAEWHWSYRDHYSAWPTAAAALVDRPAERQRAV